MQNSEESKAIAALKAFANPVMKDFQLVGEKTQEEDNKKKTKPLKKVGPGKNIVVPLVKPA